MHSQSNNSLETYLGGFSETDWQGAVTSLLPSIHEVDRNAVLIWFRFYPLSLHDFLSEAPNIADAKRSLAMQGDFGLHDRVDSSHRFLYGHRYWKTVKAAIEAESQVFENEDVALADEITQIATMAAERLKVDASLLVAITAVGFITLRQVGLETFKAASGEVAKPQGILAKSPDAVLALRSRDDSQGILGFLKTVDKKFSIIHDESRNARF